MGDKAKEILENPDWFELLCNKDDVWALNDLRSACLKIKKSNERQWNWVPMALRDM